MLEHPDCVKELAKVKWLDWYGANISFGTLIEGVQNQEVKKILEEVHSATKSQSALINSCFKGNLEHVQTLLAEGVSVNSQLGEGITPLVGAMGKNHTDIVKLLLDRPETKLVMENIDSTTALHFACLKNAASVIILYCQDKRITADIINQKDKWGNTPLMEAVENGSLDALKELSKVDLVDWNTKDGNGRTVMEVAFLYKQRNVVRYLRSRNDALKISNAEKGTDMNVDDLVNVIEGPKNGHKQEKKIKKRKSKKTKKDSARDCSNSDKESEKNHSALKIERIRNEIEQQRKSRREFLEIKGMEMSKLIQATSVVEDNIN